MLRALRFYLCQKGDSFAQFFYIAWRNALRGERGGVAFQILTRSQTLKEFRDLHGTYREGAVRLFDKKSLAFQAPQRLAQRRACQPKRTGEAAFDQDIATGKFAMNNHIQ